MSERDTPAKVASNDQLGHVSEAPRWWRCDTHGPATANAWGCPDCVAELRRWKSTHGPRLAALEGLYRAAQQEAAGAAEAIATLASERAANALLTEQVRQLELAEEGAKEAFGHVVQQKQDAEAECKRLRELLEGAHASIRRMSKLRGA